MDVVAAWWFQTWNGSSISPGRQRFTSLLCFMKTSINPLKNVWIFLEVEVLSGFEATHGRVDVNLSLGRRSFALGYWVLVNDRRIGSNQLMAGHLTQICCTLCANLGSLSSSHILVVVCFRSSSQDSFGCVMVTNGPILPMACRNSPSVQLRIQTLFDPSQD